MGIRARLVLLVTLVSFFSLCFCWSRSSQTRRIEEAREASGLNGSSDVRLEPPAAARTPEMLAYDEERRLRSLGYDHPHDAVKAARALLASPDAGPATTELANKLLPQFLLDDVRKSVRDRKFDDADDALKDLVALGNADEQVTQAQKFLDDSASDRIWAATSNLDTAQAEELLKKELQRRGEVRADAARDAPRVLAERRLKKWVEGGRSMDSVALEDLEVAASLVARNTWYNPVVEALATKGSRGPEDRCRAFEAAARDASSYLCWVAARSQLVVPKVVGGPESRTYDLQARLLDDAKARAALRLQEKVASQGSPWISARNALEIGGALLNRGIERADLARRLKEPEAPWQEFQSAVLGVRVRLYVADARRQLAANEPDAALRTLEAMFHNEVGWLFGVRVNGGWDAWAAAPSELKASLEANGTLMPADRTSKLRSAVEQGQWRPDFPELMAAETLAGKARLQWGLAQLDAEDKGRRELGEELLRSVLRESKQVSDSTTAIAALQQRLRDAGKRDAFDRLLELVSFYAAEVALAQSKDPFRDELKALLVAAAEHYRPQPGLQRLFLLTLLADVFPADHEGQKAREEALSTFFTALDRAHAEPAPDPKSMPPSGLAGLTVDAVENATSYHLLLFFDGPERFFVRVAPRRRGSVVFKDGLYKHGAVVTDASIIPARGEPNYQSKFIESRYKVVTSRAGKVSDDLGHFATALGTWPLLRAPEGEPLKVDPQSGRVSRP